MKFDPSLEKYIERAKSRFTEISDERKALLKKISKFIIQKQGKAELIFICTHNSRRSHFAQIWAQIAAWEAGLRDVRTYSGGTEATAFNPNAIAALERSGIKISRGTGENPKIGLKAGEGFESIVAFSKVYDDSANPSSGFLAAMTCSEADEGCPVVHGAESRVSLHYQDPKISDGTPEESSTYDERCLQIATEMFYIMSQI